MGVIYSAEEAMRLGGWRRQMAYNAFDVTGTLAVANALLPRFDEHSELIYKFERACCSPAMAMMRRGVRVDTQRRTKAIDALRKDLAAAAKAINKLPLIKELWDGTELETGKCRKSKRKDGRHTWPKGEPDATRRCEQCNRPRTKRSPFNGNSHYQTTHLFHDILDVPPQKNKKGEYSVDEEVTERIGRKWPKFKDLTEAILEVRSYKKQIGFLNSPLTADNRFMSSVNVGTAWTGRWSNSVNPYRLGNNLQNVAERARGMFVADPGMKMFYADLEQAESRTVAYVAEDEEYITAHESGDVHTFVCRMLWPDLEWTGDLKQDKVVAKENPPWDLAPGHEWRFQAKRCQHGLNYGLTPRGVSAWAHIPLAEATTMYERYFDTFPGIKVRQERTTVKVQEHDWLENPLGRRIKLFGRPWDPHTVKQAFSFIPQSTVADVLNLALWHVWNQYDPELIWLLAQVHDAILGQFPRDAEEEAVPKLLDAMSIPVPILGRTMTIPVEVAVGLNWGKKSKENPNGLVAI